MHFIYLLLHPQAETRYRIHLYSLRMKNNFYPVLDIRNERLHSHCFPVTESHPRVFVSQESWELPHSFFATKSWEINGGESTDTRGKRIILAGRDARARRVQRKLVKFHFYVPFAMHLHGKRARRGPTPVIRIINGVMSPCWRHVKFPRTSRFVCSGTKLEASVDREWMKSFRTEQQVAANCRFILIRWTI